MATGRPTAYAAKIAAETILSEPPTTPDLSDEGIARQLANCVVPPKPNQLADIRAAFCAEYTDLTFTRPAAVSIVDDAVCRAGCCVPACHTALARPCCGECMVITGRYRTTHLTRTAYRPETTA
jgi:hypothetical protein